MTSPTSGAPAALRVRWLTDDPHRPAKGDAAAPPDNSVMSAAGAPAALVADTPPPRPSETPAESTAKPAAGMAPQPGSAAERSSPQTTQGDTPAPDSAQAGWVPREALTAPPRALGPIVIAYPAGVHPSGPLVRLTLALYIDERGHVRRTAPVGERPEAAFELAANDAFLQARFTPGRLGPHVVRSRVTVEVLFEAQPDGGNGAEPRGVRIAASSH